ncbi:YitT family protein [Pannonibacter sp. SL95]|uniref:YitT family protein n=1 Tax=Pannonibacter sp. SL95 TaxID=2995153 RepID=UPI00227293ED|nr:YitT family protein [Pannonibacter sp. SL95]MCY1708427.1 YitT family protein [Pannonibacter sp. SL95]
MNTQNDASRHGSHEDVFALVMGTLFVAFGMLICAKAQLLTGGLAGVALLLQYVTGTGFWIFFALVNLPFFVFAPKVLGWPFTLRSLLAVAMVSLLARAISSWIVISEIHPLFAAIMGGGLTGTGLLMLFRHGTALGGFNILVLFLQNRFGLRAGYVQMALDLSVLLASALVLAPANLAWSVLTGVLVNLVLAFNHRPGRYQATTGRIGGATARPR